MAPQIKEQSRVLKLGEVSRLPQKPLPRSLDEAAGLLKRKYADLRKHYQKIREEWSSYSTGRE